MQLNLYVPRGKAGIVKALNEVAHRRSRPKNEIVLEAVEQYLDRLAMEPERRHTPSIRTFNLGTRKLPIRSELYEEALGV